MKDIWVLNILVQKDKRQIKMTKTEIEMLKIPENALPVIKDIRKNIKRPKKLPVSWKVEGTNLRWYLNGNTYCPLGFHPALCCIHFTPFSINDFSYVPFTGKQFQCFIHWFDKQTDAKEVVKAIWGK